MTVPHVRVHVPERALTSWLLLDVSPSMAFGTADRRKTDVAEGVAIAVGHLSTQRGNRLGVLTFGGLTDRQSRPMAGRAGLLATLGAVELEADGTRGRLQVARGGPAVRRPRGAGRRARRAGLGPPRAARLAPAARGRRPAPQRPRRRGPRSPRGRAPRRRRARPDRRRDRPHRPRRHLVRPSCGPASPRPLPAIATTSPASSAGSTSATSSCPRPAAGSARSPTSSASREWCHDIRVARAPAPPPARADRAGAVPPGPAAPRRSTSSGSRTWTC